MRKHLQLIATTIGSVLFISGVRAQNTSPYWSLAGNSNATSSSQKLGTTTAYPLRITTNNTTRMYISPSAGYVGVGTTSPSARLHVNAASGTSPLKLQVNGATKLYMSSGGGLSVGSGSTAPANGLYVAGNVGLGTTAPASGYKLHVVGKGRFTTGLVVNDGGIQATTMVSGGKAIYASARVDEAYGIYGDGFYGVFGNGMIGVQGNGEIGVLGVGDGSDGVRGESSSENVSGVSGYASGANANGIYGSSVSGYAGYFDGSVYTTGSYLPSDRTLKQNVADFQSALAILSKLQPKTYEYRQDGNYKLMHLPEGVRYGLIAQDVEQVLPGLVRATTFQTRNTESFVKSTAGAKDAKQPSESIAFKAVNYNELIPIIIKGMQEQEAENKALKEQLADQQQQLAALRQMVLELKQGTGTLTSTGAYLEQNTPNPVRGNTTIRYYVPGTVTTGYLNVTNAKGQLVNTIRITKGASQVSLNTGILASGTYIYTLYVDGQQADSKRFVIAK